MKIINDFEQGSDEWIEFRKGKISGTILGDIYSKPNKDGISKRKIGFYQIIADKLGDDYDGENLMDRGLRLEDEANEIFEQKTGLKTEKAGVCVSAFNPEIINSPDRLIKIDGKYSQAVEIKCLGTARHLQAVIENEVPAEFESQKIQYFICNDELQTLNFVFYDPRIQSIPYHCIEVKREDIADKIELFKEYEIKTLEEIAILVERLAW